MKDFLTFYQTLRDLNKSGFEVKTHQLQDEKYVTLEIKSKPRSFNLTSKNVF